MNIHLYRVLTGFIYILLVLFATLILLFPIVLADKFNNENYLFLFSIPLLLCSYLMGLSFDERDKKDG